MPDIQQMIKNLKKVVEDNTQQREINLEIIHLFETLVSSESSPDVKLGITPTTVFEYLNAKNLANNNDIILHIAFFAEKFNGMRCLNVDDIKTKFEEARLQSPKNINDYLGKLEKNKKFLIECKEKKDGLKAWKLSSSGLNYIESFK